MIPVFVGNIGIKPLTTPILRRFGFRRTLVVANCAAGVTLALCAAFTAATPLALIVGDLLLSGIARSVGFTAYNTIVFADVAQGEMNNANTLLSTIQQLTMGLGVAVGGLALYAGAPIDRLLGIVGSERGPFVVAFLLVAVLPFVAVVESVSLARQAGATLIAP